jgi:hypothetical protein
MEYGLNAFAVGKRSCIVTHNTHALREIGNHIASKQETCKMQQQEQETTFIGASKDFATDTITGVKKTQKMS